MLNNATPSQHAPENSDNLSLPPEVNGAYSERMSTLGTATGHVMIAVYRQYPDLNPANFDLPSSSDVPTYNESAAAQADQAYLSGTYSLERPPVPTQYPESRQDDFRLAA